MHQNKSDFKLGGLEKGLIIFVILAIAAVGVMAWLVDNRTKPPIANFSDCVAAGNPILETYPEQCSYNGRTFTNHSQEIEQIKTSNVYLDKANIPDGWGVSESTDGSYVRLVLNSGLGRDSTQPSCDLQASIKEVPQLDHGLVTSETLLERASQELSDNQGHQTTVGGRVSHSLSLNNDEKVVEFYQLKTVTSDSEVHLLDAYIVGQQAYSHVSLACHSGSPEYAVSSLRVLRLNVY